MASGEDNFAGIVGTDGADGFDGGERDRCRGVVDSRGAGMNSGSGVTCDRGRDVVDSCDGDVNSGSGVTCGIDGADGAGGDDVLL